MTTATIQKTGGLEATKTLQTILGSLASVENVVFEKGYKASVFH